MKLKIYIAGKITGDPNYKSKFERAAKKYAAPGVIILNPATLPEGLTRAEYMRICFAKIDVSDMVVFLEDYKESDGAQIELAYCKYTDKGVIFDKEGVQDGRA